MNKPNILIFLKPYLPGFKAGGAIQAVKNITDAFGDEYNFYIVTSDRDMGDNKPYSNIKYNVWQKVGKANVRYLSAQEDNWKTYKNILRSLDFELLYLQSFWCIGFSLIPLLLLQMSNKKNIPVLLHPRGQLLPGALLQKRFKKQVFLFFFKLFGLYKKVFFNVSSLEEKEQLQVLFPHIKQEQIFVALDVPSKVQVERPVLPGNKGIKLGHISRIDPQKNLLELIKQISCLTMPVHLDIYGAVSDMNYWKICQEHISKLPNNIKVFYQGALPHNEVMQKLPSYDLFCLFTKGENFGYVIYEALACGVPVLISDKTPWHEVKKYNAGWEIPYKNPSAISSYIMKYVSLTDEQKLGLRSGAVSYAMDIYFNSPILEDNRQMFNTLMKRN